MCIHIHALFRRIYSVDMVRLLFRFSGLVKLRVHHTTECAFTYGVKRFFPRTLASIPIGSYHLHPILSIPKRASMRFVWPKELRDAAGEAHHLGRRHFKELGTVSLNQQVGT